MRRSRRTNSTPLRRRRGPARVLERIVIFCEGKVTEPCYFEGLRVLYRIQQLHLETIGMGSGPGKVVERAVSRYRDNRKDLKRGKADFYEQVWAVFDRDEHQEYESSIKRCEDVGVGAAYSNPCFELWLILHDCDMDQPLTRQEAQSICRERNLVAQDARKRLNCRLLVDKGRVLQAENRAARQRHRRIEEALRYGPPATNVGSLTQMIRSSGKAES